MPAAVHTKGVKLVARGAASKAPNVTRILVADDHPVIRKGLSLSIEAESDLTCCGEAESVSEALTAIEATHPDVIVVDLSLKNSSGIDLLKDIAIRHPRLKALVLSMQDESYYAERALRAGAKGYLTKSEGGEKVIAAIRKILGGDIFLTEAVSAKIVQGLVMGHATQDEPAIECLTDRELDVFRMIGQGMRTREIALNLHLSPKTIDSHRERIKRKLNLKSGSSLVKQAIQMASAIA